MKTRLMDILPIKYPIIQGAMAWISDAVLAAAATNAGGAGIIAAGGRTADYIRDEIRKAKTLTDGLILLRTFATSFLCALSRL